MYIFITGNESFIGEMVDPSMDEKRCSEKKKEEPTCTSEIILVERPNKFIYSRLC